MGKNVDMNEEIIITMKRNEKDGSVDFIISATTGDNAVVTTGLTLALAEVTHTDPELIITSLYKSSPDLEEYNENKFLENLGKISEEKNKKLDGCTNCGECELPVSKEDNNIELENLYKKLNKLMDATFEKLKKDE